MNPKSQLSLSTLLLLSLALAAGAELAAQTITLTDGDDQCDATLVDLEINPQTGDVTANVDSGSDCLTGAGSSPGINSFTVNGQTAPVTVNEGTPVTVAWNSSNTTSCQSGGTLPSWLQLGPLSSNGSFPVSTSSLPNGERTLELSCTGSGGGEVNAQPLTVTIQNSSLTGACATRQPPPGLTRATEIVVGRLDNAFLFESVFIAPFPGNGNSQKISIADGQYAAMEFTTGSHGAGAVGSLNSIILQPIPPNTATGSDVKRLWSISACPGDFRKAVLDVEQGPGCVQGGADQSDFRIGGDSADNFSNPNRCALKPNTTYFLNLLYTNQSPPTNDAQHDALTGQCSQTNCGNAVDVQQVGL